MIATIIGLVILTGSVTYLLLRPRNQHAGLTTPKLLPAEDFISDAQQFVLDFDYCVFKDSSYSAEVEVHNTNAELAAVLVGSPNVSHTSIERQETIQSVLFYQNPGLYNGKRFFDTFPFDVTTLKFHVMQGNMKLYVDGKDSNKYLFLINI